MDALSRRHLFGAAGALATLSVLGRESAAQARDRLVIGMSLEPPVLDPTRNAAAAIREVTTPSIFESLGRIDRTGAVGPGLAESWNVSEDGKEYIFKIRPNVKFHDGEPLDAAVVKYSLDRLFAPESTNPAKSLYTDIEKVEVVDPSTVKVTLKSPNSFLLYSLSLGDAGIMHPKTAATNDKNPIGTGPFMFKERKEGDSITLVKSPTYRDAGAIKLETVIFKIVKDPSAQVSALLAGDVDAFPGFQAPELVDRLKKDPRFVVVVGTTEGEVILATNNGKKPFDNPKVRQAMAHAINRDELISAESGFGVPIGSHFAPHNKAYIDLTKTYPFDIAKGKALLAEAGYPNGFEASLKLPPVGYAQRAGEVLASQLGKIGIKVAITQLQWPQWLAEVFKEKNYDLTIVAHTEANDLDRYARDGYYWNYNSPEFKAKWREVVATTDFTKRDELLKECQRIIARDAANGFLYQLAKIGVWKKELVGMWENDPSPSADFAGLGLVRSAIDVIGPDISQDECPDADEDVDEDLHGGRGGDDPAGLIVDAFGCGLGEDQRLGDATACDGGAISLDRKADPGACHERLLPQEGLREEGQDQHFDDRENHDRRQNQSDQRGGQPTREKLDHAFQETALRSTHGVGEFSHMPISSFFHTPILASW